MLTELHIKNMAIVRDVRIPFGKGLTVLTGETGAGKSMVLSGLAMLLGGRADRSLLRDGEETRIEATFLLEDEGLAASLSEEGVPVEEDGILTLIRTLSRDRSVIRCNGEIMSLHQVRRIAPYLLDIHGQRDDRMLLETDLQRALIDSFDPSIAERREKTAASYEAYLKAKSAYEALDMDERERARLYDLLSYEAGEIRAASLKIGEEEQLTSEFRVLSNASRILEGLGAAHRYSGNEEGAADLIGMCLRELSGIASYDPAVDAMRRAMEEVESLLSDVNRDMAGYIEGFDLDEERLAFVDARLTEIRRIISKYGGSEASALGALEEKEKELSVLEDHEAASEKAAEELSRRKAELETACAALSAARRRSADRFEAALVPELQDLHFAQAVFHVRIGRKDEPGPDGYDRVEFYISTNP